MSYCSLLGGGIQEWLFTSRINKCLHLFWIAIFTYLIIFLRFKRNFAQKAQKIRFLDILLY